MSPVVWMSTVIFAFFVGVILFQTTNATQIMKSNLRRSQVLDSSAEVSSSTANAVAVSKNPFFVQEGSLGGDSSFLQWPSPDDTHELKLTCKRMSSELYTRPITLTTTLVEEQTNNVAHLSSKGYAVIDGLGLEESFVAKILQHGHSTTPFDPEFESYRDTVLNPLWVGLREKISAALPKCWPATTITGDIDDVGCSNFHTSTTCQSQIGKCEWVEDLDVWRVDSESIAKDINLPDNDQQQKKDLSVFAMAYRKDAVLPDAAVGPNAGAFVMHSDVRSFTKDMFKTVYDLKGQQSTAQPSWQYVDLVNIWMPLEKTVCCRCCCCCSPFVVCCE